MNKRLQKKKKSMAAGMNRKEMRQQVHILTEANDILVTAVQGLRKNKESLENRMADMKHAHICEVTAHEKENAKLRCQNKALVATVGELNKSLQDTYRENTALQLQLIELRNRSLVKRIINKGVN